MVMAGMDFPATGTVFKSEKITYGIVEDYKFVSANQDITRGEVIFVQHAFSCEEGNYFPITNMIRCQETLFNNLSPRKCKWHEDLLRASISCRDTQKLIAEKIESNVFGCNGRLYIGDEISQFNHSKRPNAYVTNTEICFGASLQSAFFCTVVANVDICKGEEIFIKYNDVIEFSNTQVTALILAVDTPNEINENICKLKIDELFVSDVDKPSDSMKFIEPYLATPQFNVIMTCQHSIHLGLYLAADIIAPSPRFNTYFIELNGRPPNQESISHWLVHIHTLYSNYGL